jgi:hypothetical protein
MSADTSGAGSGERRERQAAGGSCQRWLRCLDGRPPLAAHIRRCRPACSSPYSLAQDQERRRAVSDELSGQLCLVARNDHYARKAHGQHQSIRALIRRFTVRLSSQSVTDHSREPPPGGLGSQAAGSRSSMVTWRHLQRRRRRYRSRAGPGCRGPGHTSSSSADPRAKRPPARPAAALRRPGRR